VADLLKGVSVPPIQCNYTEHFCKNKNSKAHARVTADNVNKSAHATTADKVNKSEYKQKLARAPTDKVNKATQLKL
jgi:hypothetical protein